MCTCYPENYDIGSADVPGAASPLPPPPPFLEKKNELETMFGTCAGLCCFVQPVPPLRLTLPPINKIRKRERQTTHIRTGGVLAEGGLRKAAESSNIKLIGLSDTSPGGAVSPSRERKRATGAPRTFTSNPPSTVASDTTLDPMRRVSVVRPVLTPSPLPSPFPEDKGELRTMFVTCQD